MPLLNTVAKLAAKPFPNAISPRAHAIIDYITVGGFFMSAAWFWGQNKRAAIAALISGGAELAVSLLTDYPGGVMRIINLRTHRDIDFGLGAMTATMPEFLAFKDDDERKFFLAQGALITAISQLTQVPRKSRHAEHKAA
jgi:hypothetical protein